MSEQKDILSSLVMAVAEGEVLLHDDRQNLMSKEDLVKTVSSNRFFTLQDIQVSVRSKIYCFS